MRIVLIGASGQLGCDCLNALNETGHQIIALTRRELDFTDEQKIQSAIEQHMPDVVINACAYTAVDKAEQESELADQVNHKSVAVLSKSCADIGSLLIHISTDYVFDGRSTTPYTETDPVNPSSVYGQTKLAGERAIAESMERYIILRTSWVFGANGNNFVKTMLRLAADRDRLGVVSDQFGRPTYTVHIVNVIIALVERYSTDQSIVSGIYHCSSEGVLSWHEFACKIFNRACEYQLIEQPPQVDAITTEQYPTPAPRPMYSVLDTGKLERYLGTAMPSWEEGLDELLKNIKALPS